MKSAARSVARSLGRATIVSTHFHDGELKSDTGKAWYRFAHGQRGMIGWIEKWFDGKKPRPWLAGFGETLKELAVLGTKLDGATFDDDGIGIAVVDMNAIRLRAHRGFKIVLDDCRNVARLRERDDGLRKRGLIG